MNAQRPTEKRFEKHIEKQLHSAGYNSVNHKRYDRNLCLIRDEVIGFIKDTQPEEWGRLLEIYGIDVETKVLSRISAEISKRGIIDVLRKKVVDRGIYLELYYPQPNSDLNQEHKKLFLNNRFVVMRQLYYSTKNNNSVDMALFLNGLPLATMELKNQLTGQNINDSERQYSNDRDPREPLFKFKRCMVHFCVDNDKVSMTTKLAGKNTFFLPFNKDITNPTVENGYRTEYLWQEILNQSSLLNIIENFVHVAEEKEYYYNETKEKVESKIKEVLIFPRYHQLDLIKSFRQQLKKDGIGKKYLVQHTTGSGKSYSIGWLAHTLTSFYRSDGDTKRMFDSIIVVTDRRVLDDQLRNTISSLRKDEGLVSGVKSGSKELRKFLEQGKGIITTTIQKFPFISEKIGALGDKTFAVIIDEVHSSQSGELSKELKKTLSKVEDDGEFDYEEMLLQEISNRGHREHISFFGFTGTPKEETLELFGTKTSDDKFVPFHVYSMDQSIQEKFTLDVLKNYTTYALYFKLKQIENKDKTVPVEPAKRELMKFVDDHPETIRKKVSIILNHFSDKSSKKIKGKARGMIVTQSRKHCVMYFKEVNHQLEERGLSYNSLVAFSGEVHMDGTIYSESGLNKEIDCDENVPAELKKPKYRLLIVANKFQTGFDEPLMQSMYVDKKMEGVQCVQTLSRLNRTASGKTETFVLDFVNDPEDVKRAFQRFYQSTVMEGESDPNLLYELKRDIYELHLYTDEDVNRFCQIFYDKNRDDSLLHPILDRVVNKFIEIGDKEDQDKFRIKIQTYIKAYGYLSQIINFADIELEKTFVFLNYLNKKLPRLEADKFDVSDAVDLDSLRVQKTHEHVGALEKDGDGGVVKPPEHDSAVADEPKYDMLSEVIQMVNDNFGANFDETDRVHLEKIKKELLEDANLSGVMSGQNTEDNKRVFFKEKFDKIINKFVNEKLDFYRKITKDPAIKEYICREMRTAYHKDG